MPPSGPRRSCGSSRAQAAAVLNSASWTMTHTTAGAPGSGWMLVATIGIVSAHHRPFSNTGPL
jgi:hypothetical protein